MSPERPELSSEYTEMSSDDIEMSAVCLPKSDWKTAKCNGNSACRRPTSHVTGNVVGNVCGRQTTHILPRSRFQWAYGVNFNDLVHSDACSPSWGLETTARILPGAPNVKNCVLRNILWWWGVQIFSCKKLIIFHGGTIPRKFSPNSQDISKSGGL